MPEMFAFKGAELSFRPFRFTNPNACLTMNFKLTQTGN
jgi:hypothetical protein